MTIDSTTNRVALTGNGVTVDIPFPYAVHTPETDLVVIATVIATGIQTTKAFTTDWTWAGSADAVGHYPDGGTVTALVAPPSTETWTVYRDPPATQGLDLVENDGAPAEAQEAQFDYLTMLVQRVKDQINRTLQQPEGDATTIARLPSKVERASMFLAFDANGNPIAAVGTTSDFQPVSVFIDTLLDDANAATARATLGAVGLTGDETIAGAKTFSGILAIQALLDLSHTSAGQIKFPAVSNPSNDGHTLDEYDEHPWTPVLTFATPGNLSVAYTTQLGFYTKIGNVVHLTGTILTSTFTHTTASGVLKITGLPFLGLTNALQEGALRMQGWTKANYTQVTAQLDGITNVMNVGMSGSAQAVATMAVGDMPTGGTVRMDFNLTYLAAL